ncbi:MAG: hypothetical protein K2J20_02160, partial [Bacilli bacterium]|nr:hypothetical protein [Bacilli bacterium]
MHNFYFTYDTMRKFYALKKTDNKSVGVPLGYKEILATLNSLVNQNLVDVIDADSKVELVFENNRVVVDDIRAF